MAQTITPPRSTDHGPGRRSGGGGFTKFVLSLVVVAVLGGIGYTALRPHRAGPDTPAQTIPASAFDKYIEFFNEHATTLPAELSVERVTNRANDCANQATPNKPEYLNVDALGRAQGGWVCLHGRPTAAVDSSCPAPGTNDWRAVQRPSLPRISFVDQGHLIGKSLGGEGDATRGGGCANMTPQSRTPNRQMGQLAERYAQKAAESPDPIYYLSVAVYTGNNYMPTGIWIFLISATGAEAPGPFLNEPFHIAAIGAAP